MARTRTLSQMRSEVRQRADIEGSQHITDTEIDRLLNLALARLYGKMVEASEDDFVTTTTITTVSGTEEYALPATFLALREVEATIGGIPRQFRRWDFADRHLYTQPWSAYAPLAYRLVGTDTIRFLPQPNQAQDITIWYIPAAPELAADGDTWDGRNGWEEWAILDAAVQCRQKTEEDCSTLLTLCERAWSDIAPIARAKDRARPQRVQDVVGGLPDVDYIPRARW